jgi:hypothetical protein
MEKLMTYLAYDGNWGDADGLLIFNAHDLPEELYSSLVDDPEGSYEEIRDYLKEMEE